MKYKDRDELVSGLRELADFIEKKGLELPKLDVWASAYISEYPSKGFTRDEGRPRKVMRRVAKILAPCEKKHSGTSFSLERSFGPIEVTFRTSRAGVCKKVVVGTVHHPEHTVPAYTEEKVEWVCDDPLLATVES